MRRTLFLISYSPFWQSRRVCFCCSSFSLAPKKKEQNNNIKYNFSFNWFQVALCLIIYFLIKRTDPLDVIVETCNRLTTKTTELATFYGESAIGFDPGVFFTQIINFKQEFEVGVKQHKEKELRQKKAKEREIAKNKKEGKKITDDNKTKPTVDLKDFTKPFNISNGAAKREKTETETTESVVDSQIHVDAIPTTESNQPGDN